MHGSHCSGGMKPMYLSHLLAETRTVHDWLSKPTYLPGHADVEVWCHNMDAGTAAVFILVGVLLLFFGYTLHRLMIALTAAVVGAYLGGGLASRVGFAWIGAIV